MPRNPDTEVYFLVLLLTAFLAAAYFFQVRPLLYPDRDCSGDVCPIERK